MAVKWSVAMYCLTDKTWFSIFKYFDDGTLGCRSKLAWHKLFFKFSGSEHRSSKVDAQQISSQNQFSKVVVCHQYATNHKYCRTFHQFPCSPITCLVSCRLLGQVRNATHWAYPTFSPSGCPWLIPMVSLSVMQCKSATHNKPPWVAVQ